MILLIKHKFVLLKDISVIAYKIIWSYHVDDESEGSAKAQEIRPIFLNRRQTSVQSNSFVKPFIFEGIKRVDKRQMYQIEQVAHTFDGQKSDYSSLN